jgi:hypothetical protein
VLSGVLRKHVGESERALFDLHHHEGARLARLGEIRLGRRHSKGRADAFAVNPEVDANPIQAGRSDAACERRSSAPAAWRGRRSTRAVAR